MRTRSLVAGLMVLAAVLGMLSLTAAGAVSSPQDSSTLSFTLTTTSSYFVTTGGSVKVSFNSVQLDTGSPQAYAFGVVATAAPGYEITGLNWYFGDGTSMVVPYCCHSQVSEVQYHAYPQPGSYTVLVVACDTGGDCGNAQVTVNWITPVPEYPNMAIPLLGALLAALATLRYAKSKRTGASALL